MFPEIVPPFIKSPLFVNVTFEIVPFNSDLPSVVKSSGVDSAAVISPFITEFVILTFALELDEEIALFVPFIITSFKFRVESLFNSNPV